jgi:hypothetical protein
VLNSGNRAGNHCEMDSRQTRALSSVGSKFCSKCPPSIQVTDSLSADVKKNGDAVMAYRKPQQVKLILS